MEPPNSTLLPYILDVLARKPEFCDSVDMLCDEIEQQLDEEQNTRYGNVRAAVQRALNVGQSLGILTVTNEDVRVPLNFRFNNKMNSTAAKSTVTNAPRIPHGRARSRRRFSSRRRTRSRSSRRGKLPSRRRSQSGRSKRRR